MRPRDILANNLRALMAARPDLGTLPKITARSGVSNGTLDRIRRAAVSTRVDELDKLGRAFGIEAKSAPFSLFSSVTQSPMRSARGSVWARRPVFAGRCIAPERSSARVWSTAAR